ncbi:MAG: DUF1343 domain-containing protein [Candidatus Marinimicrobia bacterium]|nr:DUF1343 domain-containing protein [Candidatus Neomarinimicrobiota bacterium]
MTAAPAIRFGLENWVATAGARWRGARLGLVAHGASRGADGQSAWERLAAAGCDLVCGFAPEHGWLGRLGAGETVGAARHPTLRIPIYSLYGADRRPRPEWLAGLAAVIYDLQDLPVRCYTYGSTLRYLMEACAAAGCAVIVADRPAPGAGWRDGPLLETDCESFVGCLPTPYHYGLTSGALARLIKQHYGIKVELIVSPCTGCGPEWPNRIPWTPPSPGIRTVATAETYPVTVLAEALPLAYYGQGTPEVFQGIFLRGAQGEALARRLPAQGWGYAWRPQAVTNQQGERYAGIKLARLPGATPRPARAALAWLAALGEMFGPEALWNTPGARPAFFDQLWGTTAVRRALEAREDPEAIAAAWNAGTPG